MTAKNISKEIPTNITEDFFIFINYIANNQVKLTKTQQNLSKNALVDIYSLMSEPKLVVKPTKNQDGYPLLHLFFSIGLQLQLIRKTTGKGGVYVTVLPERLAVYQNLTATDQYLTLLQCFWEKLDWEELTARHSNHTPTNIDFLFEYLDQYPINKEIMIKLDSHLYHLLRDYGLFLFYFSYFGFWQVELDDEMSDLGKYFTAKTIKLKLLLKLLEAYLSENWLDHREEQNDEGGVDLLLSFIGVHIPPTKKQEKREKKRNPLISKFIKTAVSRCRLE